MQWVVRLRRPSPFSAAMVVVWLALQTVAPLGHARLHAAGHAVAVHAAADGPTIAAAAGHPADCVVCLLAHHPSRPALHATARQPATASGAMADDEPARAHGVAVSQAARGPPCS